MKMLRNRYIVIVVCILFSAVLAYNVFFFGKRMQGKIMLQGKAPSAANARRTTETPPQMSSVTERDNQQWKRDPFRYPSGAAGSVPPGKKLPKQSLIILQGVMLRHGSYYALLNGRVYRAGDRIDDLRIVSVRRYSVVVAGQEGEREIYVYKDTLDKER
jgi:hypothetical protein